MIKEDLDKTDAMVSDADLAANGVSNSVTPEYEKGVVLNRTYNEYQGMPDEVLLNDKAVHGGVVNS